MAGIPQTRIASSLHRLSSKIISIGIGGHVELMTEIHSTGFAITRGNGNAVSKAVVDTEERNRRRVIRAMGGFPI